MMLHPQDRKPQILCHYSRIVFRMHVTDNQLWLYFQQCFKPMHRLFQRFYSSQIFQISHIRRWIKPAVHTNAERIFQFSTHCHDLSFPVRRRHERQRCISSGTADHIRFTLIKIHNGIVCPYPYLSVMG